jgi:hypothetical protein
MSKKHQKWLEFLTSIQNNTPALMAVVTVVLALAVISGLAVAGMALWLVHKVLG